VFDSHCHPTDIDDPVEVIEQALRSGLRSLLACGYNADSNLRVEGLHARLSELPIALGIHPWFAAEPLDALRSQLLRSRAVAIGECGLDATEAPQMPPLDVQRRAFEYQLGLAKDMSMPVTVHSRKAVSRVYEIVERFSVRGVLHAFTGSYEQAKKFIERGWLIGIGGAVTRVGASRIRSLAQKIPLSSIALETDAPAIGMRDLPPPHVRPAHLHRVAEAIAELRDTSWEQIAAATNENIDRLFGFHVTQALPTFHGIHSED
jgi:TatD DNase family protein